MGSTESKFNPVRGRNDTLRCSVDVLLDESEAADKNESKEPRDEMDDLFDDTDGRFDDIELRPLSFESRWC